MTARTATRRRQRRYSIGRGKPAEVTFDYPHPGGPQRRLPLLNVSRSGISFALAGNDDLALIEPGTRLETVVLNVGDCEIHGEMLVMHVTPDALSQAMCGALFYPASDVDLIKLRSVVAGMDVVVAPE